MLPHWHMILRWAGILFPLVVTSSPVPGSGPGPRKSLVLWLQSSPFPLRPAVSWGTQRTQSCFLRHRSLQPAETPRPPLQLSFTAPIPPPPLLLPPVLPFCLPSFPPFLPSIDSPIHPSIHLFRSVYLSFLSTWLSSHLTEKASHTTAFWKKELFFERRLSRESDFTRVNLPEKTDNSYLKEKTHQVTKVTESTACDGQTVIFSHDYYTG